MSDPGALAVRAGGEPGTAARFREQPADFCVEEELGWHPDGEGEHLFLRIEKTGISTTEAVRMIAARAGLRPARVSHAGLKDRQGVCVQWLSLHLPGREDPDFSALDRERLRILEQVRNSRRLRIGAHAGNRFTITLRGLRGMPDEWEERLSRVTREGVPNYFGEQRFGRNNPAEAAAWLAGGAAPPGRQRRGILLSAARSLLFNRLLSRRVAVQSWNRFLPGDVMMLEGSNSHFPSTGESVTELQGRVERGDLHPTGPLWGAGLLAVEGQVRALEETLAAECPVLCRGLEQHGLRMQRRSLRVLVRDLEAIGEGADTLRLQFRLPPGSYATAVLRELCHYSDSGPAIGLPAVESGQDV